MSDGCGTYAHWPLRVWAATEAQARRLNELTDVEAAVVAREGALPDNGADVEFVVAPFFGAERLADMLAATPKLRVIQSMSAGVDDILAMVPEGVRLCDARGVHDVPVAEWVLSVVLASIRGLPLFVLSQAAGRWEPWREARELCDSRVLIVGHGSVGAAVEHRLAPFGARITRVGRTARDGVHGVEELGRLLPDADIVIVLVPLTAATKLLVDKDFLAAMPAGALLVNAARGAVVDTDALVAEVQAGRLRAALDVTDPEPLPAGHPLWRAANLLLTPHVASSSNRIHGRIADLVVAQVERYRDGTEMDNVVSGDY